MLILAVGPGRVRKGQQPPWVVSDCLWERIEPPVAVVRPASGTGRPRVADPEAPGGILFVLYTGIQWEFLPRPDGCTTIPGCVSNR
jgi:transposase